MNFHRERTKRKCHPIWRGALVSLGSEAAIAEIDSAKCHPTNVVISLREMRFVHSPQFSPPGRRPTSPEIRDSERTDRRDESISVNLLGKSNLSAIAVHQRGLRPHPNEKMNHGLHGYHGWASSPIFCYPCHP
jgi:hypothetical protein